MDKPKYIYLARSIRGDKATDTNFVKFLIHALDKAGHEPQFNIPIKILRIGLTQDEYIYQRDLAWIDQCGAMIAEVTYPSHGVGYEIAYAKHVRKIPIFCAAQKDTKVSAMIAGAKLPVFQYRDVADLAYWAVEWLGDLYGVAQS